MNTPLIIQVQSDCLDESISIITILRKSQVAATKLELIDFLKWIEAELNGYEVDVDLPRYRRIQGTPQVNNPYHGWRYIDFSEVNDEDRATLATIFLKQSIAEIDAIIKDGQNAIHFRSKYSEHISQALNISGLEVGIMISSQTICNIPNTVRNTILKWTLELEKQGIIGENMSFPTQDKQTAATVTNNIYSSNIGSVAGHTASNITVTQNVKTENYDLQKITNFTNEVKQMIGLLPSDIQGNILENVNTIDIEVAQEKPNHGRIKSLLIAMKGTCENATGSLMASGILTGINALLAS